MIIKRHRIGIKPGGGVVLFKAVTPFATASRLICLKRVTTSEQIQELLGYKDVSTTMIYTHVLNKGGKGVKSPMDGL